MAGGLPDEDPQVTWRQNDGSASVHGSASYTLYIRADTDDDRDSDSLDFTAKLRRLDEKVRSHRPFCESLPPVPVDTWEASRLITHVCVHVETPVGIQNRIVPKQT